MSRLFCALSWAEGLTGPTTVAEAVARQDETDRFWREWLRGARFIDHRWRVPIERSALAIKGLTYMPTGATVAALTTSLPETPRGERNWDYRYTWMRDTTFTLQALHYLNLDWEADEFMEFVADVEPNDDGGLQIMYGIDGRRDLTESTRDDLTGYDGARPVRIGNGAFDQRQNDVFGAVLDRSCSTRAGATASRVGCGRLRCASGRGDARLARSGPGDLGGARQAAALRFVEAHVLGRARPGGEAGRDPRRSGAAGHRGETVAEEIKADILAHGVRTSGVLRQHYDTDALDASYLLAAIFGFLPGDDMRGASTVEAIADDLTEEGFVLRYRTEETDDGLSGKEGTFLICSFWLVSALAIVGEVQRARDLMERLLQGRLAAGPLRGGVRGGDGPASGQRPAGLLASRADRGGGANHRPRDAG